jgi:nucleotide-binding universal stress UspA family protein
MLKKILLAFDGSETSKKAGELAIELASKFQSDLLVVSVIEDIERYAQGTMNGVDEMVEEVRKRFDLAQEGLVASAGGVKLTRRVVPGHAVETILQIAEQEKTDAIIVGGLGHSRILRRVTGGTGSQIAYHARCTVIVVR